MINVVVLCGYVKKLPREFTARSGNTVRVIEMSIPDYHRGSDGSKIRTNLFLDIVVFGMCGGVRLNDIKVGDVLTIKGKIFVSYFMAQGKKHRRLTVTALQINYLLPNTEIEDNSDTDDHSSVPIEEMYKTEDLTIDEKNMPPVAEYKS